MHGLIVWSLLLGCGGDESGSIHLIPDTLSFGEVDFVEVMPAEGYGAQYVEIHNVGDARLNITIPGFDGDRICLEGFEDPEKTIELPELASGQLYALKVGICGYQAGELTSEVTDSITLNTDGNPATSQIVYTYTPVTNISIDTGR
jgi:hypothetical protein